MAFELRCINQHNFDAPLDDVSTDEVNITPCPRCGAPVTFLISKHELQHQKDVAVDAQLKH